MKIIRQITTIKKPVIKDIFSPAQVKSEPKRPKMEGIPSNKGSGRPATVKKDTLKFEGETDFDKACKKGTKALAEAKRLNDLFWSLVNADMDSIDVESVEAVIWTDQPKPE